VTRQRTGYRHFFSGTPVGGASLLGNVGTRNASPVRWPRTLTRRRPRTAPDTEWGPIPLVPPGQREVATDDKILRATVVCQRETIRIMRVETLGTRSHVGRCKVHPVQMGERCPSPGSLDPVRPPGPLDRIVGPMRRLTSRRSNADLRSAGVLSGNAAKPIEFLVKYAEATEQTHRRNPRAWLA
jgi:hypothetical protein